MSVYHLEKVFQPGHIALIGASERKDSVGSSVLKNLIDHGYSGDVFPVNPKYKFVHHLSAYDSIMDIHSPLDLAIISVPLPKTPPIIKQCVEAKVGGAIIISAGGKESGEEGRKIESAIQEEAKKGGLRIIGPNCLGVICSQSKLNASFADQMPLPGKMAFISQSGAICTSILDLSLKEKIGFSYFVSLGSMLDVDFGDLIDYIGADPNVSSIVIYMESLSNFRKFMSAARAVSGVKPIVVLKAGRSQAGAAAAASHTGALAGADNVYDAAFSRAGIVRVKTFEELFDCAELLAKQPVPSRNGLAIITNAGGPGVMAVDALADYRVKPAVLSSDTFSKINQLLPPHWSHSNPIDILGDASHEIYRKVAEICLNAPEIDGLLVMFSPQAMSDPVEVADSLVDLLRQKSHLVLTCWLGGSKVDAGREVFNQAGIPTFDSPERAIRAFMNLYHYDIARKLSQEIPPKLHKRIEFDTEKAKRIIINSPQGNTHFLSELDSKSLMTAYGIPVNLTMKAETEDEAVEMAHWIGFPVAMKIHSNTITHKSDANGILLNLAQEDEVRKGFRTIIENVKAYDPLSQASSVTVQQMIPHGYAELIIGAKKDRDFGPVIVFGMGGTFAEIIRDTGIALPPLNRLLSRRLIESTNVYRILKGYRNHPPIDFALLEELLIRLSQLVSDFPEIEELDLNPVIVTNGGVWAADSRVVLKPSTVDAPMHLVISSYPNQFEETLKIEGMGGIQIRPIRPEDAPLMVDLFNSLSKQSVYFRFFSPLKELPHTMLTRFTQIDYDRQVALVAIQGTGSEEKMLAVARVIQEINLERAEFAVLVGDQWQGKGIGAALLSRCLNIAKSRNVKHIWGTVLSENKNMLALGQKLNFEIERTPGAAEYTLTLDF